MGRVKDAKGRANMPFGRCDKIAGEVVDEVARHPQAKPNDRGIVIVLGEDGESGICFAGFEDMDAAEQIEIMVMATEAVMQSYGLKTDVRLIQLPEDPESN